MATKSVEELLSELKGKEKVKILFVCLGNICRSPAAEGVFCHLVGEEGIASKFEVDSAGTYAGHAGELPDGRMRWHAAQRGYNLTHRSRPVRMSDFEDYDLIIGMDDRNYSRLRGFARSEDEENKIVRMIDLVRNYPHYDCVPDPYYEGAAGFEIVLDLLEDGCRNLLDKLR